MAVATFGTVGVGQAFGTPVDATHTIPSGQSNVAIMAAAAWPNTQTHTSDVWDPAGVSETLTELAEDNSLLNMRSSLSGLAGPSNQDDSSYTLRTTYPGSPAVAKTCVINLSGVDQTTPFSNAATNSASDVASTSIDVTTNSDADDWVIATLGERDGGAAPTSGDTEQWNEQIGVGDLYIAGGTSTGTVLIMGGVS